MVTLVSCGSTSRSGSGGNPFQPQGGVFTRHYNNARTGANTSETILTPANVNAQQFGILFQIPVDGFVMAQPLYVPNLNIPNQGTHNVVYVATENNTVYAFDADGKTMSPLWQASMNPPGGEAVPCTDIGPDACVAPALGITATPTIDPASGTIYVEARSKQNGSYSHHLHALDITTGQERSGSPVTISASVPGNGDGGATVNFDPLAQNSRPALLLQNGVVYLSFGSIADLLHFHGWFLGYDAKSLKQVAVFCSTPNGAEGSFWNAGGPAGDGASVFNIAANGDFGFDNNFGDTVFRFDSQLRIADSFTPFNQADLDSGDVDLGSGGPALLPDEVSTSPRLLITAGKEGRIYLLSRDHLGGFNAAGDQVVQEIPNALGTGAGDCSKLPHCAPSDANFSTPAYWHGKVYFGAMSDVIKAFSVSNGRLSTSPVSQSAIAMGVLGVAPVISANGNSNGILWVLDFENGFLRAFDANNLGNELFEDGLNVVEFTEPTVFNGKVYVGTQFDLTVYGLK
jgi:outer membrane protein assembly factor BamB